jgi:hypothetical protein
MKRFLRFLFRKKETEELPPPQMEKMLGSAKANAIYVPLSPEENRYAQVKEEHSVTSTYEVVKSAMQDAVSEKRKAKEAAQRVSAAVGTAGQEKPKS